MAKIKVKAINYLHNRRFKTIKGIDKKQYRLLKQGETIEIDEKYFDSNLFKKIKEVKNGNE